MLRGGGRRSRVRPAEPGAEPLGTAHCLWGDHRGLRQPSYVLEDLHGHEMKMGDLLQVGEVRKLSLCQFEDEEMQEA